MRELALLALCSIWSTGALAANCYAVASANWNVATTWANASGGVAGTCAGNGAVAGTPGTADNVFIGEAAVARAVTVPAAYAASAISIAIGNSANNTANSLSLAAATSTLTTTGAVTVNRPGGANTSSLNIDAGTATVGGTLTLAGVNPAVNRIARIRTTTGTLNISGDLVFGGGAAASNLLLMSGGAGTVNLAGAFTATVGTLTPGATSIFNYNGSVAQTVRIGTSAIVYNHLHLNNSNAAGATLNAAISAANVTGNLRIQSGILNNGGFAIVGAAADTFQIASGARFNLTGATGMPSAFGTYTLAATSTTSFQGGNQTIAAVSVTSAVQITYGHVIAQGGSTKTAGAATPPAALNIAGNLSIETGTTFTADANDPIINVTGNMAINGTGIYTASNNAARPLTVSGNFTVGGTYTGNVAPLNVAGDFTRTGTFTSSTGLVTLNGSAVGAQTVTGATTITNLAINNTGGGVSLASTVTVGTLLTLTSGVVTTGANTLITSANCPGSVSRASGHINGNLQLRFNTGAQSCTYHVGDGAAANYTPVLVSFTNVSVAGSLIGSATSGDYADTASPIDAAHSVNRHWTLALPGAGALAFTGSYGTAFTYLAADNDPATTVSSYAIARGAACGPPCTWTLQTVSGTPTTTAAAATGITASFGVFAIGRRRVAQFAISVPGGTVSTCNAASVTITAQDSSAATADNYTGTINISTSTTDGDWSLTTGNGTLTNAGGGASGVVDDGLATYAFNTLDLGVVTLSLSNVKVNSDVTVTAVDNANAATSSTSTAIQFRGNVFTIANDTVQVAGRNQSMTVTRDRGSGCSEALAEYAGAKPLKAWYTLDGDHPAGANAPAITGAAPAITTSVPGANNLTLTFTSGVAPFTLTTTDVGKYVINLRDDATGTVDGASPTITTRPFTLVVSAIKKAATNNPGGTATAGSKFIVAADSFQATLGAYLWSTTADTTPADGSPDASATLAQITAAGATPSYRWATVLAAASPFTPAAADGGTLATLGNGTQTGACPTGAPNCFTGGVATPSNLGYDEVGSFTLTGSASNFLNSGVNLTALVFDNQATPARNAVVGRFYPDHFTLLAGSSVTPACVGGGFTYMGQPNLGYSFAIEARSLANAKTSNYLSTYYAVGTVSMLAENNNNGTDLSARLPATSGSWAAGTYTYSPATVIFSRPASPDGPFDLLRVGVQVTDADGVMLASRDMDPATNTDCTIVPTCTGTQIGGATTRLRFGRLRLSNAYGSELLPLRVPVRAEYFNGTTWTLNAADNCTSLPANAFALSGGIAANTSASAVALTGGTGTLTLAKPSPVATGSVDVAVNLGTSGNDQSCLGSHGGTAASMPWLRGFWAPPASCNSTAAWAQDPNARVKFGSPKAPYIYLRERY